MQPDNEIRDSKWEKVDATRWHYLAIYLQILKRHVKYVHRDI